MSEKNTQKSKSFFQEHPYGSLLLIAFLISLWYAVIPAIIGLVMLYMYIKDFQKERAQTQKEKAENEAAAKRFTEENFLALRSNVEKEEEKLRKQQQKLEKLSYLYNSVKEYVDRFADAPPTKAEVSKIDRMIAQIEADNLMNPTVEIALHNTEMKDLRRKFREVNKDIDFVLKEYESRYTTKGNLAIYRLMVVALRSELQNVLYTMKFGKLSDAESAIDAIADKYIKIAADGNQSIAPTITKFVMQTRSLFVDAARIEYEYYMRKERAKEEQRALREKMREEAEERKRLEAERKKIEAEEEKFKAEIEKVHSQLAAASAEQTEKLLQRIRELEQQQQAVSEKKETIAKLQNGKAGCVYVISNLGSFGDHVFKVGMTRRVVPQERIDELGDASVPFSFDVHSFIFSEDAAALETEIHHRLNEKRVNKVNLRKEFFDVTLDELEALVYEIQPTAEFNRTMAAEQYRQSLSMSATLSELVSENIDDDEDFDE